MTKPDIPALFSQIKDQLAAHPETGLDSGIEPDELARAIAHPKAAEQIQASLEIETQAVNEGERAPDFTLNELSTEGGLAGQKITLSDHFGKRPVALIFGSYT